ncbi:MAG: helicase RecG protein, partial [Parcubacteria group bacterium GW2011_GWA2_51_10]
RGRVGRSDIQSYCYLLPEQLSGTGEMRLRAMEETTDGFKLAQKDLELRGAGNVFGNAQSGFPDFQLATLQDIDIIGSPKAVAAPVGIKTRGGGFSIGGIIGTMASAKTAGLINPTIGGAETGAGPAVWPGIAVLVTAPNLGGTITVDPAELATRFVALAQALRGQ